MKTLRIRRLFPLNDKPALILALDHGFSTPDLGALWSPRQLIESVLDYFNAVIINKGLVRHVSESLYRSQAALIIHLSGCTSFSSTDRKIQTCTVEEAVSLGADAVSIHISFGGPNELEMLKEAAVITQKCNTLGIPSIVMAYKKGEGASDEITAMHMCRISMELGADIVKIINPQTDSFYDFVRSFEIPVLFAGGEIKSTLEGTNVVHLVEMLKRGAKGLVLGRSIFQSADPVQTCKTLLMNDA